MIEIAGLRKTYGALVAADDVGFSIARGETFGLLGPNGAGKTTTILCAVGALAPDAGRISIAGLDDPMRAEVRRAIGIAPQRLSLYEELTGSENLAFFANLYGLHGARLRERVAWALEFAGLADRARDQVRTYSGGMQRRLNIACALVHEPRVLFLDEPTVGVDPQSRNHIFESIQALGREGLTILYTTHYMEEAQRLCARVGIMDQGRLLAVDTVPGLLRAHGAKAVVTAELDGMPRDRALPGQLDGDRLRVETDRPEDAIRELLAAGVPLRTLQVDRPDLESVFLKLTGRSLRD
jgi:ABC-2 type transport system ATP-binding protein